MTNEYASPEDRIRLAEFCGKCSTGLRREALDALVPGGLCMECGQHKHFGFDPLNDHADCHALIRALNDAGIEVSIRFWVSHAEIEMCRIGGNLKSTSVEYIGQWDGQNWKHGLVTLALEVIK